MRHLVVLSGGMDSTTLLYQEVALCGASNVLAVSVDYQQRHRRELDCASQTCDKLGVEHHVVTLPIGHHLTGSALTDQAVAVPDGHYEDRSMMATVVPNRNMLLLTVATSIAIVNGCNAVSYGAHAGDRAIYPDCRKEFVDAMSVAMRLCHYEPVELLAPFVRKTKTDIAKLGDALGVNWLATWSCYKGGDLHCGTCGTCNERREAFLLADLADPTQYAKRQVV